MKRHRTILDPFRKAGYVANRKSEGHRLAISAAQAGWCGVYGCFVIATERFGSSRTRAADSKGRQDAS
jgi:hypothetical protein